MPDVERQVRDFKTRIQTAQKQRAFAEHEREVAQAAADQALRQLWEEFSVDSIQQAMVLVQQLETAVAVECSKVEDQLVVAEGSA